MDELPRVLIVDDDLAQAEMVSEFLRISGFDQVDHVATIRSLWENLEDHHYDILLLDYKLPDGTGLDVLDQFNQRGIKLPVVMITGQGTERVAAQAIQRGAADYLLKSGDYLLTLPALIRKTIRAHELALSVQRSLEQIRYQAMLLNNVRDAVVVWDMENTITYWNPAAAALFGWNAEDRLGRSVNEVYLSSFEPVITLPETHSVAAQTAAEFDEISVSCPPVIRQYNHPAQKTIWISSRVTPLIDSENRTRLLGYMDVAHDITPLIETEQALRQSEARYRAIVEDYQTEMICRFQPNGALTFANEVFCKYFNKSRSELLGMNILYFVPENERPRLVQHLISFSAERQVATLEHQVSLPMQGLRWLQRTDRAIIDTNGHIFEFQSVARDITAQKRLEAQIQAAQAHLVQAARLTTIGEMASGVAHQIYNPLTTIIADAQLLLRNIPADHPAHESAEAIEQAGWRLQEVVQRLMEFSRPAAEVLTQVSVNDTLRSALSLVTPQIESAACRLEYQLAENIPLLRGNPRQLENLWVNLLLLARDAVMHGNGSIIRLFSVFEPPSTIVVEVHDDGLPIPLPQLAAIFEPNFIGPTSGRGSGMELSICREIVRQHNGQISAISAPGSDTIFRVELPQEV